MKVKYAFRLSVIAERLFENNSSCVLIKKKVFMRQLKNGKADSIQGEYCDRYADHCNGVLSQGKEIGLHSI